MRTWKWSSTAALLASLSAAAQTADSQPCGRRLGTANRAPRPRSNLGSGTLKLQAGACGLPAPTTMDQVVDRFIEREHGLMKMLSTRTPVVETYLQNLTADPQLGPVPSEDHYFLGRMDMGETVDRKDYLKEQDKGMETRLMGGFHKLLQSAVPAHGFLLDGLCRPHRLRPRTLRISLHSARVSGRRALPGI